MNTLSSCNQQLRLFQTPEFANLLIVQKYKIQEINFVQKKNPNLQYFEIYIQQMSRVMRKPTFCICENKGADQLCSVCKADQRLCFCYKDSTVPLLSKSECFCLLASSSLVQLGLCRVCLEATLLVFLCRGSNVLIPYLPCFPV